MSSKDRWNMPNVEIQIIFPRVSDEPLTDMLVAITKELADRDPDSVAHGLLGGEHGYGGRWDSDVFQMHPYCWCEDPQCAWCAGCYCHDNSWRDCDKADEGTRCDWCAGVHRFAEKGALPPDEWPHYGAPHFWHKASGLKVWWYKYIGRDMQTINLPADLTPIFAECVADIRDRDGSGEAGQTPQEAGPEGQQPGGEANRPTDTATPIGERG